MRLSTTRAECKFHPIGQGLFYSVLLKNKRHTFSAVYDCGTKSSHENLKRQIEQLKFTLLENSKLDLLILSHLHDDHVNGVPELLKDAQLTTVIFPYITPASRVIYAALAGEISSEMALFYSSPTAFFTSHNVKNIIQIIADSNSTEIGEPLGDPINETSKKTDGKDDILEIPPLDNKSDHQQHLFHLRLNSDEVAAYMGKCLEDLSWNFRFAIPKTNPTPEQKERYNKLVKQIENKIASYGGNLAAAIGDKKFLDEIRKQYYDAFGAQAHNCTSILCAHYPSNTAKTWSSLCNYDPDGALTLYCHRRKSGEACNYNLEQCDGKSTHTLLTGDTQITDWSTIKDGLLSGHCANVILVPHHGGSPGDKKEGGLGWLKLSPCHAVICYGLGNDYGHPFFEVLDGIHESGKCHTNLLNEYSAFYYSIHAVVD